MDMIIGGAYQGKLDYAKEYFSIQTVSACSEDTASLNFSADAIYGLEDFALACVRQGVEARDYLESHLRDLQGKVVVCTDISQGIVPMDPEMRALREMMGRAMVYLAKEADTVTRVFCGLGSKIK